MSLDFCPWIFVLGFLSLDFCPGIFVLGFLVWEKCPRTANYYTTLKEIKKFKFDEPHRFKKKGNEDQYRSNVKVGDAIKESKEAC